MNYNWNEKENCSETELNFRLSLSFIYLFNTLFKVNVYIVKKLIYIDNKKT